MTYDGAYYAPIGDFLGEAYLNYGFTQGTRQEVDFLGELLALPVGARVLDVGCGPGRHSLELARRGCRAFGVDITPRFIEIARARAAAEGLPAEFAVQDARQLRLGPEFDAAICLCEGAFGLAGSDDGHRAVLRGVAGALKPGALFVLSAIHALSAARQPEFDPYALTLREQETATNPAGETRAVEFITTAFTYRELKWLLEAAGFVVEAGYGCVAGAFARAPLTVDSVEVMMVARRAGG